MNLLSKVSIYYLLIIFLLSLYFVGAIKFGFEKVLWQLVPPLLGTIIVAFAVHYPRYKSFKLPITPTITGLIIGLVGQFGEDAWKLIAIGAAAMVLKRFIKFSGRHIFNPAASGLVMGTFLGSFPSWWVGGGSLWLFLIWVPILLYKFKRWALIVGFLLPVIILSGWSVFLSSSILFFIFVLLIEPKTSPFGLKAGLIYGVTVALFNWVWGGLALPQDSLILALLTGNFLSRLLEKYGLS